MGTRTGNPTWVDYPSTATLVTADNLNNIEAAIDASATTAQGAKADTALQSVVAGTNVTVNNADPRNPIVSATGGTSAPDATPTVKGIVQLAGDLGGTAAAPTVVAASATTAGKVELATDAETQTGTDTARAITPANLSARTATETRTGVVELATVAEATTGTDTTRAITAAGLAANVAAAVGARIPASIVDAKGDIIAATGADAVARVAVGTNNQVLTADSTVATGVKWATPAAVSVPAATETVAGIAEIATSAEVTTGTDDARTITPLKLQTRLTALNYLSNNTAVAKGDVIAASGAGAFGRTGVGADGLVLTADAASPLGVKWAAASGGGGGIPPTLLDAKGDLIVASAADTAARLAVGADAQVLTADSTAPAGVKWATPSGGGGGSTVYPVTLATPIFPAVGGNIQGFSGATESQSVVAMFNNYAYAHPFLPTHDFTIDRIGIAVVVAAAASTITVGLYASSASLGGPGALIATLGVFDTSVSGNLEVTTSQAFTGGTLYWFGFHCIGGSQTLRQFNAPSTTTRAAGLPESLSPPPNRRFPVLSTPSLPDPWPNPASFAGQTAPSVSMRRAS